MIDEFPTVLDARQNEIIETAKTLETISYQVAELLRIKEELDKRMCALLEHSDEGQKTYIEGKYKILIKSGILYSLDKEKYEMIGRHLSSENDPVNKVVKFELNKKVIRDAYASSNEHDIKILDEILTQRPSKLSVTISAGC